MKVKKKKKVICKNEICQMIDLNITEQGEDNKVVCNVDKTREMNCRCVECMLLCANIQKCATEGRI